MRTIRRKLYKLFIAPRQVDEDIRNREIVLNVLLAGTAALITLAILQLVAVYIFLHATFVGARLVSLGVVLLFVLGLFRLSRYGLFKIAAGILAVIYFVLATLVVYEWGIGIASGELAYGLVIVLSGILLGPRYALYAFGLVMATLVSLQVAADNGVIHPSWQTWATMSSTIRDVIGFGFIFGTLALVSWLFNYQMERSLHRAKKAETALMHQKEMLESEVEKRTGQLQAAQLEKIQQMYRFAELGQLSTALLHELANHLTTLTLDIEGLEAESRSRLLSKVKRTIHYMDDMVLRVRDQLHGKSRTRAFNVVKELSKVIEVSLHKAGQAHVGLSWEPPANKKIVRCHGEPVRFRQLMVNLISNAIDAYDNAESGRTSGPREVIVIVKERTNHIVITVNDWGRGIAHLDRSKLFEAFYSTKKTGMGMGLFIARRIAEQDLRGSLTIDPVAEHTAFVLKLPKA